MIWVDVFGPTNEKIAGPVVVRSAKVSRVLDGAGTISLSVPLSQDRASELFQSTRRVEIYTDRYEVPRLVGRGFIRTIKKDVTGDGFLLTCDGPDFVGSLDRHTSTLNSTLSTSFSAAVGLVLGGSEWAGDIAGTWPDVSLKVDVESVLTTIINLVQSVGIHLRYETVADDTKILKIGAFGDSSSIFATNQGLPSDQVDGNENVILISSVSQVEESNQLVNFLVPIGKGVGSNPLTLQDSTFPDVQSFVDNFGNTLFYISDQTSINNFGISELTKPFRNIVQSGLTVPELQASSDALYIAARSWMARHSSPQTAYKIKATKLTKNIFPGQTIKVFYDGVVSVGPNVQEVLRIDNTFYITKVDETLDNEDYVEIEISTVDRRPVTPEKAVAQSIQASQWSEKELMKSEQNWSADVSNTNVSNPPTKAQITSAFGLPASVGDGFVGVIDDNGSGTTLWLCVSKGSEWFYQQLTKSV